MMSQKATNYAHHGIQKRGEIRRGQLRHSEDNSELELQIKACDDRIAQDERHVKEGRSNEDQIHHDAVTLTERVKKLKGR